jgi:hypothetical protein
MSQSDDDIGTAIEEDIGEGVGFHDSSDPEAVYLTTKERIKLVLMEYTSAVEDRTMWKTPFVLFLSSISVFFVSDFKSLFGLSESVWKAFFIIVVLLSLLWLLKSLNDYRRAKQKSSVAYVINRLEVDD